MRAVGRSGYVVYWSWEVRRSWSALLLAVKWIVGGVKVEDDPPRRRRGGIQGRESGLPLWDPFCRHASPAPGHDADSRGR